MNYQKQKILKLIKREDYKKLERNIISYGTKKSKLYVKNPNLPIKDSPELREILIHMMCDGCFSGGYAAYYNHEKETKEEFIKELKISFGEVDFEFNERYVHFSPAIMLILKKFFQIEFNSKKCRIPKEFFKGNKRKLIGIIRAIIIDEGTIDGGNIRIDSCNREFLEDIKKICNRLGYKTGKIWESKGPIFRFNILAGSFKRIKRDMKNLPLLKKQQLINLVIKNQQRKWKYKLPGEIKKEIIKSLIKKPKRTIELILELNLPKTTIGNHLRWLIKKNLINYKINKNIRTYFIKNREKVKDFIKNPSRLIKSEKINNYGLSQLRVLKMLNKKKRRYNEIEKHFKFNKSSTFKLISSLVKKDFIKKIDKKGYKITNKGKKILSLNEKKARYLLYANVKII